MKKKERERQKKLMQSEIHFKCYDEVFQVIYMFMIEGEWWE